MANIKNLDNILSELLKEHDAIDERMTSISKEADNNYRKILEIRRKLLLEKDILSKAQWLFLDTKGNGVYLQLLDGTDSDVYKKICDTTGFNTWHDSFLIHPEIDLRYDDGDISLVFYSSDAFLAFINNVILNVDTTNVDNIIADLTKKIDHYKKIKRSLRV